jgi:hypothetical protein
VSSAESHQSRRRSAPLSVECLEDRTVPAGNVTAVVVGGVLQVEGDGSANLVWVEGLGGGQAIVTGLGGTRVNGSTTPIVLGGIDFAYHIRLGDGNDGLWVTGAQGDRALWVDLGSGDDRLAVAAAWNTGPNVLQTGTGNDVVSAAAAIWDNVTFFDLGEGDDALVAAGIRFGSALFNGGSGANTAALQNVNFLTMPFGTGFLPISPIIGLLTNPDTASVRPGESVTIAVLANDSSPGQPLDPASVAVVTAPRQGTARVNPDGSITYTANAAASGTDSFQYTVRNSAGEISGPTTVSVTVGGGDSGPPNPPPSRRGPVPSITTSAGNPTNLTPIPFTVSFDKPVTGFDLSDVSVTNGQASGLVVVDSRRYTFNVIPDNDGVVLVRIPAGAARDAAGNPSAAASFSLTADTPPRLTIRANSSTVSTGPIVFTATINQAATGFTVEDLQVTGGPVSDFTTINARTFRFTVTPDGSSDLIQIEVPAGSFTDSTGNANLAARFATLTVRNDLGMAPADSPPSPSDPNWVTQANGLKTWTIQPGSGPAVTPDSTIGVYYTGWLLNGTVFDSSRTDGAPAVFPLSSLIEGWKRGLPGLQPGGIVRLYIPAALAYGSAGSGSVPPNADLMFEIKLVSVS